MNKSKKYIEEVLKNIKTIKDMDIKNTDDLKVWTERIVDFEYKNNMEIAYAKRPHLRSLYKLIKINNFMSAMIKEDIYSGKEKNFSKEFKIVRRIHSSLSFMSSEVQMLLEQRHSVSALAKIRQVIELGVTYKIIKRDEDIYVNALEQGNYTLKCIEDFFYIKPTKESISFKEYFENKITSKKRRDPHNFIKRTDSNKLKKFRMTKYVNKYYSNEPIILHAWNSSHNFNHMSPLTFALDEKPHIYNKLEGLLIILVIFPLFKIYKEIISDSIKYAKENKKILEKNGIYGILKIYEEIMEVLEGTLNDEKQLMEEIKIREMEYEKILKEIKKQII